MMMKLVDKETGNCTSDWLLGINLHRLKLKQLSMIGEFQIGPGFLGLV